MLTKRLATFQSARRFPVHGSITYFSSHWLAAASWCAVSPVQVTSPSGWVQQADVVFIKPKPATAAAKK